MPVVLDELAGATLDDPLVTPFPHAGILEPTRPALALYIELPHR